MDKNETLNSDFVVRKNAAGNPNTPAGVLRELAKDRDWRVRMSVAHNPATSIDVLIELSKDEDDRVVVNKAIKCKW